MARPSPLSRHDYLRAAHEEAEAGNPRLASLLAEEAEYAPNTPADNAWITSHFPGGLPKET